MTINAVEKNLTTKEPLVFLFLGSNINSAENMIRAIQLIAEQCQVVSISSIYESLPAKHSLTKQSLYLNAAVQISTDKTPSQLKQNVCIGIENQLGRERTGDKNAPRTIDIDVSFYGTLISQSPIELPDPDILHYAHVIIPLAEIAPDFKHPVEGLSLSTIAHPFLQANIVTKRKDLTCELELLRVQSKF